MKEIDELREIEALVALRTARGEWTAKGWADEGPNLFRITRALADRVEELNRRLAMIDRLENGEGREAAIAMSDVMDESEQKNRTLRTQLQTARDALKEIDTMPDSVHLSINKVHLPELCPYCIASVALKKIGEK